MRTGTRSSGFHPVDPAGERALRDWAMSKPVADSDFEDAPIRLEERARRREAELDDLACGLSPSSVRAVTSTCPAVTEGGVAG